MQNGTDLDTLWEDVKEDVILRLEALLETIEGKIAHKISNYQPYPIYDTGEFLNKLGHAIVENDGFLIAHIWSDAPHTKFVLGGLPPTYVPLKPLIAWVERKKLIWTDKQGKKLTAMQMAVLVQNKIKKKGIKERNVFQEVLNEEMNWIEEQIAKLSKSKVDPRSVN